MTVPYNTGKVKIGCFYIRPPQKLEMSVDMEKLQTALLLMKKRVYLNKGAKIE